MAAKYRSLAVAALFGVSHRSDTTPLSRTQPNRVRDVEVDVEVIDTPS
jgi:hypothetical protein